MESFDPEMRFRALKGTAQGRPDHVLFWLLFTSIPRVWCPGVEAPRLSLPSSFPCIMFSHRKVKFNIRTTLTYEILFSLMSNGFRLSFQVS